MTFVRQIPDTDFGNSLVQKVLELVQFLTLPLEVIPSELRAMSLGDLVPLHLRRGGIGQQIHSFEIVCRRRYHLGGRRRHELPQRCCDHAPRIMARSLFMEHPKLDFGNQRNRGRGCSTIGRRQSLPGSSTMTISAKRASPSTTSASHPRCEVFSGGGSAVQDVNERPSRKVARV
jgi:hypothetical protein